MFVTKAKKVKALKQADAKFMTLEVFPDWRQLKLKGEAVKTLNLWYSGLNGFRPPQTRRKRDQGLHGNALRRAEAGTTSIQVVKKS